MYKAQKWPEVVLLEDSLEAVKWLLFRRKIVILNAKHTFYASRQTLELFLWRIYL